MPSEPQKVLLVDGHSMIFAWPDLGAIHQRKTETARLRLVEILSRFADSAGYHVVIVFDGRGPKTNIDPLETRVQVFYSKSGQSADSVIERLVARYADAYRITVATDDYLERTTVSTFGAEWMSSQELQLEIKRADADLTARIEQLKKRK